MQLCVWPSVSVSLSISLSPSVCLGVSISLPFTSSLSTAPVSVPPCVFLRVPLSLSIPPCPALCPPVCVSLQHCVCLSCVIFPLSLHLWSPRTFLRVSLHPGPSLHRPAEGTGGQCPVQSPWTSFEAPCGNAASAVLSGPLQYAPRPGPWWRTRGPSEAPGTQAGVSRPETPLKGSAHPLPASLLPPRLLRRAPPPLPL